MKLIEKNISKAYNTFIVRISLKGTKLVSTFTEIEKARTYRDRIIELNKRGSLPTAKRYKKRSNAKAQDLPIGINDSTKTNTISSHVTIDGKRKHISRSYGKKRTREAAIKEVVRELNNLAPSIVGT